MYFSISQIQSIMKITIMHNDVNHQRCVSAKTFENLLTAIAKDDSKGSVGKFREAVPYLSLGYDSYHGMATWREIYPAALYVKDKNGNVNLKENNGLLLLTFDEVQDLDGMAGVKQKASLLPSTFAVIEGVDGKLVHILVSYTDPHGNLPETIEEAERLYAIAYREVIPIYQSIIKARLRQSELGMKDHFLMTLDASPYFNPDAIPLKINLHVRKQERVIGGVKEVEKSVDVSEEETNQEKAQQKNVGDNILRMMNFLKDKYDFRYNTVMKYTEYKKKDSWMMYNPVDPRVQKRMTLEVQLADIRVSIKDVRNFLESDYIMNYDPIDEYLYQCQGKWDGKDHIRALARTVPTNNPHWEDWFFTWFLGMVEQWRTLPYRLYGNSVAPLLISKQGFNKSTFCRRLIPMELQWGFTDNLVLSDKRQVLQAMSQFLLVNLDEFNQISPQVQQGFLKNLIQLPSVKMKRPYGAHVEEFPRLASFIATSNMDDILTDPSGNRRFIGVELTGPIDVSVRPNYVQLFAQALEMIQKGEKTYFDAEQTALIMQNNNQFELIQPVEQYFRLYFDLTDDETLGKYMTAAEIFNELKKRIGSSVKVSSLMSFGRKLANIPGIKIKRFANGKRYLVILRSES